MGMETVPQSPALLECVSYGNDHGKGNLVGIQPWMEIHDFASQESFHDRMGEYFARARAEGWLNAKTTVVLPEYVATWLVIHGEKPAAIRASNVNVAMIHLILGNFKAFTRHAMHSPAKDRIKYAIFRSKAQSMLKVYVASFSKLARTYGVTIVAGSLVLPELARDPAGKDEDGTSWKLAHGDASSPLYNTTLVFNPDGSTQDAVLHKIFPTPQELPFTEPGKLSALPIYKTPAGRLGVLNCADSWYADTYRKLAEMGGVDFLAVPSFVEKDGDMAKPWSGKNITPTPPEFEPSDYRKISYDDAWVKYALPGRNAKAKIPHAMNVFLRGKFWDMGSDGSSIITHAHKTLRGAVGVGAAMQNIWL